MDLRVFIEPQQGASYGQQLEIARATERLGFDAFFRSDHFLRMGEGSPLPGPTDAWITLGALARETSTVRLGTLLTSATFRLPGLLAATVAQVDEMSGGRVELGLGAGWFEAEHVAYGIPFPNLGERFERLEEQLEIITGLWGTKGSDQFSFAGRHFDLRESPGLPRPVQLPRPPVIIGGHGLKKTPALAARFADEFNVPFGSSAQCAVLFRAVDEAATVIGRDPAEIKRSVALVACVAQNTSDLQRRAAFLGRDLGELAENGLAGSADQVLEKIAEFASVGVERIYLQMMDLSDLDHLEEIATTVMANLR